MADVSLRILMSVIGGGAVSSVVGDIAKQLGGTGLAGGIALAAVAVDALAVGLGIVAVKAAGDFQAQTERLVTSAGELQGNLDMVRTGLLQMSVDTATSTQQLAAGMYYVESASFHAANALLVMQAAAEGAKSENADLDVVTKALTTEMIDYHMSASQADEAMNGLIATVQNGKTNLQDLASSMGQVLPIASALGISFPQVAGSMDTMTNAGMSSRQAAMNLAHVLLALSAPSNVAVKAMQSVGLSAQQVKDALVHQGLPEALQMIEDQVGKKFPVGSVAYETALKNILGGIMGFKLAAMLTGDSLKTTEQNIQKVSDAMNKNKGSVLGFAEVQQTLNFRIDQAQQAIGAFLIILGTALLPIATRLINVVGTAVSGFTKWFMASGILQTGISILSTVLGKVMDFIQMVTTWVSHNQLAMQALQYIVIGLAVALGAILAAGLAIVLIALAAVGVAIGIVVAIIMGVIWVVQHWGQIWAAVANFFVSLWNDIASWFKGILADIANFFVGIWNNIVSFFEGVWNNIVSFFVGIWNGIVGIVKGAINTVVGWFQWLYNHNYYFRDLVIFIQVVFSQAKAWIINTWNAITTWLANAWKTISGIAVTVWNTVTTAIKDAVTTAWNWLVGVWNTVVGWLSDKWNSLVGIAQGVWNGVVGVFKGVWGAISGTLTSLWNNIANWFSNLGNQFLQWGENLINMLIQGIQNTVGSLMNTVNNIAKNIGQFLGFHSPPPQGPLHDADTYMPNMMQMYISGIQANLPALISATSLAAAAIGKSLLPSAGIASISGTPFVPPVASAGTGTQIIHNHYFQPQITMPMLLPPTPAQVQQAADWMERELADRYRSQTPGFTLML